MKEWVRRKVLKVIFAYIDMNYHSKSLFSILVAFTFSSPLAYEVKLFRPWIPDFGIYTDGKLALQGVQ